MARAEVNAALRYANCDLVGTSWEPQEPLQAGPTSSCGKPGTVASTRGARFGQLYRHGLCSCVPFLGMRCYGVEEPFAFAFNLALLQPKNKTRAAPTEPHAFCINPAANQNYFISIFWYVNDSVSVGRSPALDFVAELITTSCST